MTMMKFEFDADQQFQLDAISAVVDLFEGQPHDASRLETSLQGYIDLQGNGDQAALDLDPAEIAQEIGAVGNNLVVDPKTILENLQGVQDRNGLKIGDALVDGLDFDVEMETGTGKTYVYLRTIFELAQKYNFTKFVILVPSVAIREGVNTSITLMREHFRGLYPALPFDASVYSGKTAEEVQSFATATSVQILVMTIDSIRGDANSRIIHQHRDKLQGLRPIDFLRSTRPVVIMDEPQNMESKLSKSAIGDLDPICTLRYSATHRKVRNVVYRLDPVDAHDKKLVKQIVVAEALQEGTDATPYVKLLGVQTDPWAARLELVGRKADGSLDRVTKTVKRGRHGFPTLESVTGNPEYGQVRIDEIGYDMPGGEEGSYARFTNDVVLQQGEETGGSDEAIYREMIRETIREHFRKETQMRPRGIKVLSLFFIDKVANFLGDGTNNDNANGQYVQWFDALFREERERFVGYKELLPEDPSEYRRAYFSQIRRGRGSAAVETFIDTSGVTKGDDDAYELIMQDKTRLLSESEPTRFIFSHSALREGWDNPNVFQICTLREMGSDTEQRQTIGRGLRLPVDRDGRRTADADVAQLTVIANQSYADFAKDLQKQYRDAGVELGYVRKGEFSQIQIVEGETERPIGYEESSKLWQALKDNGYIDAEGQVTDKFEPEVLGFELDIPIDWSWAQTEIIEVIDKCRLEKLIKRKKNRVPRQLNKELYWTQDFEDFWDRISQKTTYRVTVDREQLIGNCLKALRDTLANPPIAPLRIRVTRAGLKVQRGGAKTEERGMRTTDLRGGYALPDIITELQEATHLTRHTIVDILTRSERLDEFIGNPNDFINMARRIITTELSKIVGEGIEYEKIAGSVYELRELREDSKEEADHFLDQLYKVQNEGKTDFDYVLFDSEVERQFAERLDSREDIKMFMKLPPKFKIDTPVGPYNPDWAIVKHEDGQNNIYMIRETKGTSNLDLLRPSEKAKIKAAQAHFEALDIDYAHSSPENWRI